MKVTYKQLQNYGRGTCGIVFQSCWIAHRKEANGLPVKSLRTGPRVKPCPQRYEAMIDRAMRELGMLP